MKGKNLRHSHINMCKRCNHHTKNSRKTSVCFVWMRAVSAYWWKNKISVQKIAWDYTIFGMAYSWYVFVVFVCNGRHCKCMCLAYTKRKSYEHLNKWKHTEFETKWMCNGNLTLETMNKFRYGIENGQRFIHKVVSRKSTFTCCFVIRKCWIFIYSSLGQLWNTICN